MARWTRGDSDEELVRRFGSHLAQRTLFTAATRSFQPAMAFGLEGELEFELLPPDDEVDPAAADWWTVEIKGRKAVARRGRAESPVATMHLGVADFVRVLSGEAHPVRLFVERRVSVEGALDVAARMADIFGAVDPVIFEA